MSVSRKINWKRVLLASAALGFSWTANASGETLQEAMSIALATNPALKSRQAQLDATSELKAQAWSRILPQLTAQAGYTYLDTRQESPAGAAFNRSDQLDQKSYGATLEQLVFDGAGSIFAIRAAAAEVEAAEAEYAAIEQQLLADVAEAYFDVKRAMDAFSLSTESVDVFKQLREQAGLRFNAGEVTRTDLAQADARLAGAEVDARNARVRLVESRERYFELVGQYPSNFSEKAIEAAIPKDVEAARLLAMETAPAILSAKAAERASKRAIGVANAEFFPRVTALAAYQFQDEPSTFIRESENLSAGVSVRFPIYQGGVRASRVRQAKAENRSARYRIYEVERETASLVVSTWERLDAAKDNVVSVRKQVASNQEAFDGVLRESRVGSRSTLDVLNAKAELLDTQISLANAVRDARVANYAVLNAIGILTPYAMSLEQAAQEISASH
ncbi:MAG: TolC family outer membrane protein [Pseudomonadota bacterium]